MEALEGLLDFNDGIFILKVFKNENGGRKCILGRIRVMSWKLGVPPMFKCCLSLPLRITRLPYVIILVVRASMYTS